MGRCIYIPTTPSLIEGSLIPQGQRPCVCGSQPFERFWVPGFLDYQYLSLLARLFPSNSSCTPTFFPLPPPFTLPRPTVSTNRHHLLSFSFLFSFHCCDVLLYTKERIFFCLSASINGELLCTHIEKGEEEVHATNPLVDRGIFLRLDHLEPVERTVNS